MTKTPISSVAVELAEARESLAFYKERVKFLAAAVKEEKLDAKLAKIAARNARREAAIEKARAKLAKLLAPVGTKAVRANKRPSKVKTTKFQTIVDQLSAVAIEA